MFERKLTVGSKKLTKSECKKQAKLHFDKGEYAETILYYDKILAIDPKDASVWGLRGNSKRMLKRYEEAISDFDEAIKLDPKDYFTYSARGYAKQNLRHYEEALIDLDESLKLNPKNDDAWLRKISTKLSLGLNEEAVADGIAYVKLNPEKDSAKKQLERAKKELEDSRKVKGELDEIIKKLESNALTELVLTSKKIDATGAKALALALPKCSSLTKLELENNNIGDVGAAALAAVLPKCRALTHFKLAYNFLRLPGAKALAEVLPHCLVLTHVNLSMNEFGDAGTHVLAAELAKCSSLVSLSLGSNQITEISAAALTEVLLKCSMLVHFEASQNKIGDAGAQVFAVGLSKCSSLMSLFLNNNQIGDSGIEALAAAFPQCSALKRIYLRKNKIGFEGAKALAAILPQCPTVVELELSDNDVAVNLQEEINQCLEQNRVRISGRLIAAATPDSNLNIPLNKLTETSLYSQADIFLKEKKYDEVVSLTDKILAGGSRNLRALLLRGIAKNKLYHYREAIQDLDIFLSLDSNQVEAWENRGEAYWGLGRYEQELIYPEHFKSAIQDFNEAIRMKPKNAFSWMYRGTSKLMLGRNEEAILDLREAVKLDPENDFAKKELSKAEKMFHKNKAKKFESEKKTWRDSIKNFYDKGEYADALIYCDKVFAAEGKDSALLKLRAAAHVKLSHYAEAILDFDELIKLEPADFSVWVDRAKIKFQLGRYEEAIQDFMEVVKLNPENEYAKEYLKEARRKLKREGQASAPVLNHPEVQQSPVFNHAVTLSMAIPNEQLTFDQKLGEGSFGEVYKGMWSPTSLFKLPVAIKKLKNASLSVKSLEEFRREVEVQAQLDSSGVVKLFGITSEQPYCMVMEFMEQGSLRDVLDSQQPEDLHWDIRLQMAGNMARGLAYLHGNDPIIIHGDLKSLNILVNAKGEAKLADFGLAALKTETRSKEYVGGNADKNKGPKGSLLWIAPELYRMNAMRTTATDIFSFAVVLWELASHLLPYQGAEGNEALIKDWVTSGEREAFDERTPNTPKQYSDLAQRCWDAKPENRFSAQDVVVELEELYSKMQLAPTLFSSSSKLSPTPPRRQSMNSEGYMATTGSGPVPVKSSSGYLVKSVNSPSQSPTASPKVPPRKPTTGRGGFLAKSTKPSSTASPQTPPKGSPYKGNVYK